MNLYEFIANFEKKSDKLNNFFVWVENFNINETRFFKVIEYLSENYDSIIKTIDDLTDKKKLNIYLATIFLDRKDGLNDIFLNKNICPPIFYFLEKGTFGDIFKEESYNQKISDVETFINITEIKYYYLNQMDNWGDEEEEVSIKSFIKEIKFNFENNNIYSTTLSLFILLEYKVRSVKEKNNSFSNISRITKTIEMVLMENCFKYKGRSKLVKIYDEFLDRESVSYLYKDTNKNPKSITRHMLHGHRLDLINKRDMMSLIFFIDCIYKMLFTE